MGQLKLTLSQFFRINGGSTQNRGVIPDIHFPIRAGSDSYGESEYENALPWTSIRRSDYTMQGNLTRDIPVLRKNYKSRVTANPEFGFIDEDRMDYNKLKEDITVSLSEKVRREETQEREAKKIQRKKKREAILKGELSPLISIVEVLFDSEDDNAEVDKSDDEDELTNTENNSEPADDFILMEAARIVTDLVELKSEKLIAQTDKTEAKE